MNLVERFRETVQRFLFGTTTRELWGAQEQIRRELYRFEEELEGQIERLKREVAVKSVKAARFSPEMKLTDAILAHPGVTKILSAVNVATDPTADGLDSDATLEQACHAQGLRPDDVLEKLNALVATPTTAQPRSLPIIH